MRSPRTTRALLVCAIVVLLLASGASGGEKRNAGMANTVRLAKDGWFRQGNGKLFVPLGGFHGNEIPLAMVQLSAAERRRVAPYVWEDQKTAGLGHFDFFDASDETFKRWFKTLAGQGVTALRLFPRARIGIDVLDLCGKPNPELQKVFHRAFRAARQYNIRFLLQIIPEPNLSCYLNPDSLQRHVLPRFTPEEMARLTPAQKRFMVDGKRVKLAEWFTDPDVLACQKLYLRQVLEWVAREPQIFALEVYNEQGWSMSRFGTRDESVFGYPWEEAEIRWTAEIVQTIKQRLPDMPVTLSHPGLGITGLDPFKWMEKARADFYSSHLYAGACGENPAVDFAAATGATATIIGAGFVNFAGEWGVLGSLAPEHIRRAAHRDAIWLSLMAGTPGFMQWTYEFPEEYRWPATVFAALPKDFSPEPPSLAVNIGDAYREFHDNTRYPLFSPKDLFPAFRFNRQKQADENLKRIFAAYRRSLDIGAPVRFHMADGGGISLEDFAALDPAALDRPIRAIGGYQLAYLHDARTRTWLAYLRSRKVLPFGRQFLGVPVAAPLRIELKLPAGQYSARLIDLNTNKVQRREVEPNGAIAVAPKTSDDYVLIIRGRGL